MIVKGEQANLDKPLPEAVEDNWRHFGDDPSFNTWVSDPRYRVLIEPNAGVDQ
jgi:hypothetical protein